MKRIANILCWLCLSLLLSAQETIVVGEVYDADTGEPLSNVNVYLQGTQFGTTTNADGMFLLRLDIDRTRNMVVSSVGYYTEKFKIEPHTQSGIDIALREKVGTLAEVFVSPHDNPALALMEKVRARRTANKRIVSNNDVNAETSIYVSDIQSKHLKRALWKSLQSGMIQQEDSSYLIPLYWRKQCRDSIREESTLLTQTDYQMLIGDIPESFNFYDNTLPFLSTSMLSPLAASGNTYYKYFLVDSMQVDDEKHYLLHFRTKNPFYATFNGEMTIDSSTCALRSIDVRMPAQTSINYLKELTIHQQFDAQNNLQDEKVSMLMDFAIKTSFQQDTVRIFPTILLTRNNTYLVKSELPTILETVDQSNDVVLPALDSLNNTPLFKTAKFLAYVIQTGCIPTHKYVEIGKVHHVFKLSKFEGLRVGIPFRTTDDLWKNVCLEAMVAYGFGDRAWKGMGQINIALPTERRHVMYMKYSDEYVYADVDDFYEYLRENIIFNSQINLVTRMMHTFLFNPDYYYNTMVRRREGRLHFMDEWNDYLETQAYIKVGRMGYGEPTNNYAAQPSFFYSTIGASARVSFNERKIDTYFQRRHIYNHLPVIYLGAELGSYQLDYMPSYRMYGNLQLMMRHNVDLGIAGELNYMLQAGMVFGKVPYNLLYHFVGNQTHTFDYDRFSLMNNYQYAADKYVALHAHWDGKGLLFNLIPGVRYARLRELVELKVAYGGLRNDHQEILPFPITQTGHNTMQALTIPYVEMGVGIGNILRVGEIYGIFRLTNLQDPTTPWWAVRFRLRLGM